MKMVLAIAAGGACGAVARYALMTLVSALTTAAFPYGTLLVNIVGSFFMGIFVEYSALSWSPSPEMRAFITVGCLGALTTFSTFSLDAVTLLQRQSYLAFSGYIVFSVALSILAFLAGLYIIKNWVSI